MNFGEAIQMGARLTLEERNGVYQYMAHYQNEDIIGPVVAQASTDDDVPHTSNPEDTSPVRIQYAAEIGAIDMQERSLVSTISTTAVSRSGDIVLPEGLKMANYRKNPVVVWSHNYYIPPLGTAMWVKPSKQGVIAKSRFATKPRTTTGDWFPDIVLDLYNQKVLRGFSIGIQPGIVKYSDIHKDDFYENKAWQGAWRVHVESDMMEYSCCTIPMNPEALAYACDQGYSIPADVAPLIFGLTYAVQAPKAPKTQTPAPSAEEISTEGIQLVQSSKPIETIKYLGNVKPTQAELHQASLQAIADLSKMKAEDLIQALGVKQIIKDEVAKQTGIL
jgi:hypothetical protein